MKVSVIIPTKNRVCLTIRAVESALLLASVDEVVVIVDGNDVDLNDYLSQIIASTPSSIRVLKNKLAPGAQGSRVTGLVQSQNDIVVFLDSDDILVDGVEVLIGAMHKDSSLVMAYGNVRHNGKISNWLQLDGDNYPAVLKNLSLCSFSGLVARKSLLRLDELSLELPAWQDDDFCITAAKYGPIKFFDVISAENRLSEDSISRSRSRQLVGLVLLVEKHRKDLIDCFGFQVLILWRLRQFALLIQSSSDDLYLAGGNNSGLFAALLKLFSLALDVAGRLIKLLLRPFFDRIYA